MRSGNYLAADGAVKEQPMRFQVEDILHVKIKHGTEVSTSESCFKLSDDYEPGFVIGPGCELTGVSKGCAQLLLERGVHYEKGGCKKEKHKKEISQARSEALEAWKDEVHSYDLLCDLLYIPDAANCTDVASDINCSCCKCVLSTQPDFAAQKS